MFQKKALIFHNAGEKDKQQNKIEKGNTLSSMNYRINEKNECMI